MLFFRIPFDVFANPINAQYKNLNHELVNGTIYKFMIQILILAKHSYTLTMVKSERKAGLLLHLASHFCFMSNFCSARAIGKITFLSVNASKTNFLTTKEILHEQNKIQ